MPSHRPKAMASGAIFGRFDDQSGLCEEQVWHEWVGCGCVSGLKSHKIHHYCLRMGIIQFNAYPKPHALRNFTEILANLIYVSSPGWLIWGMLGDMFKHKKVWIGSTDRILRLKCYIQVHTIEIGGLRNCRTALKSSHRPKSMVSGGIFGWVDGQSSLCERQFWHEWVGRMRLCV